MKKTIKKVCKFIVNLLLTIKTILKVLYRGHFNKKIKCDKSGTVVILANGPSLKEAINFYIKEENRKGLDFVGMNYYAHDKSFEIIKPQYYCLADPMFFKETHRKEEAMALFKKLEQVDWAMDLYIPDSYRYDFRLFSQLENKKITIQSINDIPYEGFDCFENLFYAKELCIPGIGTVAQLAIFTAINKGYKIIKLHGVEHSFINSLCINEDNNLCNRYEYFDQDQKPELRPLLKIDTGENYKISEYLLFNGNLFRVHDILNKYSIYKGTNIINCTKDSMIDSYMRVQEN